MKKQYLFLILVILFTGCAKKVENIYLPLEEDVTPSHSTTQNKKSYKKDTHSSLKPYKVLGKWYYPRMVKRGETFVGIASWYGPNFHGKLTANGEVYNMYAYTGANKIMPLGTIVRVINLENDKSVVVRINDRGPFVKDRIIDLSYVAGKKLGLDKTGTAKVKLIVLKTIRNNNRKIRKGVYFSKKNGKIKIQIGAFRKLSGAKIFKEEFNKYNKATYIKRVEGKYKVYIGNFKTYSEAENFKKRYKIKGFIVK